MIVTPPIDLRGGRAVRLLRGNPEDETAYADDPVEVAVRFQEEGARRLHELDRYCEALISIREEIREIEEGKFSREENVLKNSPHTMGSVISDGWKYSYSREKAAYPLPFTHEGKFCMADG